MNVAIPITWDYLNVPLLDELIAEQTGTLTIYGDGTPIEYTWRLIDGRWFVADCGLRIDTLGTERATEGEAL